MIDKTALAASAPLCFLAFACFIFKQVIIPFPTGFFEMTDKFIIASVDALDIKSKWGVSPFITHPNAINASNFFKFLDIVTGISNTPGTFIILILQFFGINFFAPLNKPADMSL